MLIKKHVMINLVIKPLNGGGGFGGGGMNMDDIFSQFGDIFGGAFGGGGGFCGFGGGGGQRVLKEVIYVLE